MEDMDSRLDEKYPVWNLLVYPIIAIVTYFKTGKTITDHKTAQGSVCSEKVIEVVYSLPNYSDIMKDIYDTKNNVTGVMFEEHCQKQSEFFEFFAIKEMNSTNIKKIKN